MVCNVFYPAEHAVRSLAVRRHFPTEHAKRPHVRLVRETCLQQRFRRHPPHWHVIRRGSVLAFGLPEDRAGRPQITKLDVGRGSAN